MTEIWYCNSSTITKPAFDSYLIHLSPLMQEEVLSYRLFKDQLARLVARLLIYKATAYNKAIFYNWQYLSNKKPFIPQWKPFSISHSGSYVVLAVGETTLIGIDIEQIQAHRDITMLTNYFCSNEKTEVLQAENPAHAFFNLWTKKEALLKALGDGLIKEGLGKFDCSSNTVKVNDETWYLTEVNIAANYNCHLASKTANEIISIKQVAPELLLNFSL